MNFSSCLNMKSKCCFRRIIKIIPCLNSDGMIAVTEIAKVICNSSPGIVVKVIFKISVEYK